MVNFVYGFWVEENRFLKVFERVVCIVVFVVRILIIIMMVVVSMMYLSVLVLCCLLVWVWLWLNSWVVSCCEVVVKMVSDFM